tara:strand:- start:464 stop:1177 length:714 start_codon:yes stop_codon:yes gene_type:complete
METLRGHYQRLSAYQPTQTITNLVTSVVYDLRVKKERSEKPSPESLTEISRWEMRNLHRENPGQEFTQQIDISLYYAELSIGPVLSIATGSNMEHMLKPFQTFTAPIVVAKYIQHLLVWWLTLTGNKNLAEAALYNNLLDHEKLSGCWLPHFSFLVNGEATAIEAKVNARKLLCLNESDLLEKVSHFLKPIPNDPTKEQYIPPEKQGKRGKYDPGPVFGTSIDFLRTEFEIQKFFDE